MDDIIFGLDEQEDGEEDDDDDDDDEDDDAVDDIWWRWLSVANELLFIPEVQTAAILQRCVIRYEFLSNIGTLRDFRVCFFFYFFFNRYQMP